MRWQRDKWNSQQELDHGLAVVELQVRERTLTQTAIRQLDANDREQGIALPTPCPESRACQR